MAEGKERERKSARVLPKAIILKNTKEFGKAGGLGTAPNTMQASICTCPRP
jgi:hypothetical protein